ncbi:glycosyltransferase family 4 protein [Dongia soli]|uniref:Glycosyltransferase family 4 protein n=1 Tax=Dongia soli TaxID=600628 RepID=A0ABU5E6V6_9PROT|nr:glycosyltransferase family 4 protein [Dongia soli]MDY0882025.1 glycosyltransferase family 4 protein [Dongia soli]
MHRIAFYAPLKSPDHPIPSGDRAMARLLIAAWRRQGAQIDIPTRLRARITAPDPIAQRELAARAEAEADRLIAHYRAELPDWRPQAWFTYHLYYKAVDWIGPKVAAALDIPYLLAEASHAPKRAAGDWAFNHGGAEQAIRAASAIFCLNPNDRACLAPLAGTARLVDLPPFLDLAAFAPVVPDKIASRQRMAIEAGIDIASPRFAAPWLLAVGMMRPGDKLASYRQLATALPAIHQRDWHLVIIGDGPARPEIERLFAPFPGRVTMVGAKAPEDLPGYYAAADLLVWPAVNEAFGMALLEAQACGLPVLAGAVGGVPAILRDSETGWLAPADDPAAFGALLNRVLGLDLATAGCRARQYIEARHDIAGAARILDRTWRDLGLPA